MAKRRDDNTDPRQRLSPTQTVSNASDGFVEDLNVPKLPDQIPARLADAIARRVNALLYRLREAEQERYVTALEVRLVRDAHRAVLTAYELGLADGEVFYASFRNLVEKLGYERTEVGYRKIYESR